MNKKTFLVAVAVLSVACLSAGDAFAQRGRGGGRGGAGKSGGGWGNQAARTRGMTPQQSGGGQWGTVQRMRLRDGSCGSQSGTGTGARASWQNRSGQQAGAQNGQGNQTRWMRQQRLRDGSGQGQSAASGQGRGRGQGGRSRSGQ